MEKRPPKVDFPNLNVFYSEAIDYTEKHFTDNYGKLSSIFFIRSHLPKTKAGWKIFSLRGFQNSGRLKMPSLSEEIILYHSVLTPILNVGLLTPQFIIDETLKYAGTHEIPLNSLEGLIRQIVGWREFIRAVYELS